MEIIKTFYNEKLVGIAGTENEPLFKANDIASMLGVLNFRDYLKNYNDDEKVLIECKTNGGVQKTIFLTELGLYRFLFKSNKDIALKFTRSICEMVKKSRIDNIELKSEEVIKNEPKKTIGDIEFQMIVQKDLLLKSYFKQVQCVYIVLIKFYEDGDKMLLKIGESIDCDSRNLSREFGDCYYLEIFPCYQSVKFESVILNHFEYLKHPILKKTGNYSVETLLATRKQYDDIVSFIKKNLHFYEKNDIEMKLKYEELLNENLKLKLLHENKSLQTSHKYYEEKNQQDYKNEEQKQQDYEEQKQDYDEDQEDSEEDSENSEEDIDEEDPELQEEMNKVNYNSKNISNKIAELKEQTVTSQKIRPKAKPKGYKYQMYDPKTLKLIRSFLSFEEVRLYFKTKNIIIYIKNLKNAFIKKHEHKGYRWNILSRNQEDKEYILDKTVPHSDSTMEFIASFSVNTYDEKNKDKISILKIYKTQREIADELKVSPKKVCESIQQNKPISGIYFRKISECDEKWIEAFVKKGNELPTTNKVNINSVPVFIENIETKEVTRFQSMTHLLNFFKDQGFNHSRSFIQKHILNQTECHGHIIRY